MVEWSAALRHELGLQVGDQAAGCKTESASDRKSMKLKNYVWPVIGLAAVAFSAWLLYGELRYTSLEEVWAGLVAIKPHQWVLAALSAVVAYARAGRLRPHRAPASAPPRAVAFRDDLLVHDLCAFAQYRRLGAFGRGGALSRLCQPGPVRPGGRRPGRAVLADLRAGGDLPDRHRDGDPPQSSGALRRPAAAALVARAWRRLAPAGGGSMCSAVGCISSH